MAQLSIRIPPGTAHVASVRSLLEDGRLLLEIEPCGRFDRAPEGLDGVSERSTRRALIEGLFPDAEFDDQVLRVAVPITPN